MSIKNAWQIAKKSFAYFGDRNIVKLSASLAYFTVLAFPGLLIIVIWVADIFYGREAIEGSLYHQIESFVGKNAALNIQETMRSVSISSDNHLATVIGIGTLILGATSVFSEIQDSINTIWRLKSKPRKGKGILKLIKDRLLSFSMIVTLGFILLVSLVINGGMEILLNHLLKQFPETTVIAVYILNTVLTLAITTTIFAAIFKVLPDAKIEWRHVWRGAIITAILFMVGRFLISFYLGNNRMTNAYGAAGYVIIILLWVYYSAIILYFGAAITRSYVLFKGSRIYPNDYSVWIKQIEVESDDVIKEEDDKKIVVAPKT